MDLSRGAVHEALAVESVEDDLTLVWCESPRRRGAECQPRFPALPGAVGSRIASGRMKKIHRKQLTLGGWI